MIIFKSKYRKAVSLFFLCSYFSFLLIGTLHYHHYNFSTESSYQKGTGNSLIANDLVSGGSGLCIINHFSHSILNYHFSSEGLFGFFPKYNQNISCLNTSYSDQEIYSQISPRAPPFNS